MSASSERAQRRFALAIAAALAFLVVRLGLTFWNTRHEVLANGHSDLRLYLAAARILTGPHPQLLYAWAEQQRQQLDWPGPASPFLNPPFVGLLFVPLVHLPRETALALTAVAVVAASVAAMGLAASVVDRRLWPLLALAAVSYPSMLQLALTVQPAPLVVLAWSGFAAAWARGKHERAAALLVMGLAVKPHLMLPLVLFMIAARAWRGAA